ncbi:MAG: phosphopentomutase [bacterium]
MSSRVIVIVLDGLGIGALPDAALYNDQGSNTLGSILRHVPSIYIPNLRALGLTRAGAAEQPEDHESTVNGCYGALAEKSPGKDTITGHWELMGLELANAFPTYPHGFPPAVIDRFEKEIKTKTLCNKPASGTEVINQLGDEHVKTGYPIVYTSADSVFQIAAHEDIIPLEKLYEFCRIAREILTGGYAAGRVIARPFNGKTGSYARTHARKDFGIAPLGNTILDEITGSGMQVIGIGKIKDIFSGQGISLSIPAADNEKGIEELIKVIQSDLDRGLIFCNLIDFDMVYGHRNDIRGYAHALEYFDNKLNNIRNAMREQDVLVITADHGCDPAFPGTDHTREYVPVLVTGDHLKNGINLRVRETFADVGATIIDLLGLKPWNAGKSFYSEII